MKNRPRQNGVVLVSVLWVVAALSMLVATSLVEVRTDTQLTHAHVRMVQARAMAEAGIYWAIHALLKPRRSVQAGLPEEPVSLVWGNSRVVIGIENEAGKIDVNTAATPLIESALAHAGIDPARAKSMSRQLAPDNRSTRAAVQTAQSFKNEFQSVEEFTDLLDAAPEIINRIIPWLTVYNGREGINPLAASREILSIVPGMSEQQVEAYLRQRDSRQARIPARNLNSRYINDRLSSVYTIKAHSSMDGVTTTVGSKVRLSALRDRPYEILQWRTSLRFEDG